MHLVCSVQCAVHCALCTVHYTAIPACQILPWRYPPCRESPAAGAGNERFIWSMYPCTVSLSHVPVSLSPCLLSCPCTWVSCSSCPALSSGAPAFPWRDTLAKQIMPVWWTSPIYRKQYKQWWQQSCRQIEISPEFGSFSGVFLGTFDKNGKVL